MLAYLISSRGNAVQLTSRRDGDATERFLFTKAGDIEQKLQIFSISIHFNMLPDDCMTLSLQKKKRSAQRIEEWSSGAI